MLIFQLNDDNAISTEELERWENRIKKHIDDDDLVILPTYIDFICESHNVKYVDEEEGEEEQ